MLDRRECELLVDLARQAADADRADPPTVLEDGDSAEEEGEERVEARTLDLNAQRKAYTAARSDATSTRQLAEKARADPVERASFDPFFTFFLGGVAVFEDGRRVGAVGVSGLPGEDDERLARAALERSATSSP